MILFRIKTLMKCVHYLSPTVYTHVGGTCSQVTRVCLIFFVQLVIWIVYLYKGDGREGVVMGGRGW